MFAYAKGFLWARDIQDTGHHWRDKSQIRHVFKVEKPQLVYKWSKKTGSKQSSTEYSWPLKNWFELRGSTLTRVFFNSKYYGGTRLLVG